MRTRLSQSYIAKELDLRPKEPDDWANPFNFGFKLADLAQTKHRPN
jgi:hypothetical protein